MAVKVPATEPRSSVTRITPALRPVLREAAASVDAAQTSARDTASLTAQLGAAGGDALLAIKEETFRQVRRDLSTEENELYAEATRRLVDARVAMQNNPDPAEFQRQSEEINNDILGRAQFEEVRDELVPRLTGTTANMRDGIALAAERAAEQRAGVATQSVLDQLVIQFGSAATDKEREEVLFDGRATIAKALDNHQIDAATAFQLNRAFTDAATLTAVNVGMSTPEGAVATLAALEDKESKIFLGMDPIAREKAKVHVQAKIDKYAGIENAKIEAKLDERIAAATAADAPALVADIRQLFADGAISVASKREKEARLRTQVARGAGVESMQLDIHNVASGQPGATVDITNPLFKQSWNDYFEQMTGGVFKRAEGNEELAREAETMASALISNVGVYPSDLRGRMKQVIQSGTNNEEITRFTNIFAQVGAGSTTANNVAFGEDGELLFNMVTRRVREAGMDPTTAVRESVAALRRTPAEAGVLKQRFEANFRSPRERTNRMEMFINQNTDRVGGLFGYAWLGGSHPKIPPQMLGEFDNNVRRLFMQDVELDDAMTQGLSQLNRVWAVSSVGNGGQSKYARRSPEAEHGIRSIGDNAAWINEELVAETSEVFRVTDLSDDVMQQFSQAEIIRYGVEGVPLDRIFLESDPMTEMAAEGKATYIRSVLNDAGEKVVLVNPGGRSRWFPNYESSPFALRQEERRRELEALEPALAKESALAAQASLRARGVDGPTRAMAASPQSYLAASMQGKLEARAQSEDYYNRMPDTRGMTAEQEAEAYETHLILSLTQRELDSLFNPSRVAMGLEPLVSAEGNVLYHHHATPR